MISNYRCRYLRIAQREAPRQTAITVSLPIWVIILCGVLGGFVEIASALLRNLMATNNEYN